MVSRSPARSTAIPSHHRASYEMANGAAGNGSGQPRKPPCPDYSGAHCYHETEVWVNELARSDAPRDDAPTGALASPGTRVLLTGTGSHAPGSALPAVAAVAPTVVALGQVLVERCGADPAGLLSVIDPPDPLALGKALARTASEATDVLLFYYVGHGLVGADGELHLATRATHGDSRSLAYQALPFAAVRDLLGECRA